MIRRFDGKSEFWLFSQAEHARVAGELARLLGSNNVAPPSRPQAFVDAVLLHDVGWDAFDSPPRLSPQRLPLDALEAPWQISFEAWLASTTATLGRDPYTTLLVSIHGLQQSNDAARPTEGPTRFDVGDMRKKFEVNKYQHKEIELQEQLRQQLGMAVDQPRRLGIAVDLITPQEKALAHDYRLLHLLDMVSLSLLGENLCGPVGPLLSPTGGQQTLNLSRRDERTLSVSPWPLGVPEWKGPVSFRRYPALPTRSQPELQHALEATLVETIELAIVRA